MAQYPSYKDSGFDWIGQIPSHWGLLKSKFLWRESFNTSATGTEDLLSVSQYDGVTHANGSRSESLVGYKVVEENNLVINIMLAWMGGLGVSAYNGLVSPAYCVYKLQGDNNPKYMHYLYKTPMYLAEFARHSTGVIPSRWRMYTDDFGQVLTLIPPRKEQDAMVAYLDAATAKIDEAIAQQQRMISLLNERKSIIINHFVSKGLDPNAKLKDTGIDWMGLIPEHWQVCRIKAIGRSEHGISYTPSDLTDESGVIVLRASNIRDGKLCFEDNVYVKRVKASKFLKKNDILICATNGSLSLVGKNALIDKSDSYSFGTFMLALRTNQNQNFVRYQLGRVVDNYRGLFATTTINQITQQVLGDIRITIPPLSEQLQIAIHLDDITSKIDNAVYQQTRIINLLEERKQIIINDVVTGKVQVV